MHILGVIPARYASTRLPGKVLLELCGKPMIQWVYERAARASCLNDLVVATDDATVFSAVRQFGGAAVMTADHPNGSSRAAEVARSRSADCVINIQGDEPLIDPEMIDEAARTLTSSPGAVCATLCRPLEGESAFSSPHVVKVVRDLLGDALYFSRSPIPFPREPLKAPVYEHVGIYAYTRAFLLRYVELPMTPLAETESLEQLKILEHGYKIKVAVTRCPQLGPNVNTPEDLDAVRHILSEEGYP